MAITYNNLFSQIYDFENLYNAYLKARRGKAHSSVNAILVGTCFTCTKLRLARINFKESSFLQKSRPQFDELCLVA